MKINYGKLPDPDKIPHNLVKLLIWPAEIHFDRQIGKSYSSERVVNFQGEWVPERNLSDKKDLRHNYAWEFAGFNLTTFNMSYNSAERGTPPEVIQAAEILKEWWKSNGFE